MIVIPDNVLKSGYRAMVHVEGWNRAATFMFLGIEDGKKKLITPKTKKVYYTTNNLIYTNRYSPPVNGM